MKRLLLVAALSLVSASSYSDDLLGPKIGNWSTSDIAAGDTTATIKTSVITSPNKLFKEKEFTVMDALGTHYVYLEAFENPDGKGYEGEDKCTESPAVVNGVLVKGLVCKEPFKKGFYVNFGGENTVDFMKAFVSNENSASISVRGQSFVVQSFGFGLAIRHYMNERDLSLARWNDMVKALEEINKTIEDKDDK